MTDKQQPEAQDLNQQIRERKQKLKQLREAGNPFPNDFRRDSLAADLHAAHGDKDGEALVSEGVRVSVAGRMMLRRIMGKASFATLQDMSGQIQVYVARDNLAEGVYNDGFKKWDLGDIIAASGTLFKTKTGELTIQVDDIRLLTKALRPLPDKFHGLADQETRYRQRYLDLIVNQQSRDTFIMRSKAIDYIRRFLNDRAFLEVENANDADHSWWVRRRVRLLLITMLWTWICTCVSHQNCILKRLVVGGFEKVFEINRNFRNEGLSTRHNPEFTMLEFYWGYADYHDLMDLTENMIRGLCMELLGTTDVQYQGEVFHFGAPFERMTVVEAILKYNPENNCRRDARYCSSDSVCRKARQK